MNTSTQHLRTKRWAAVVALTALGLAACGDDNDTTNSSRGAPDTTATAVTDTTAAASTTEALPYPTQVDATLTEYNIEIPSEIPSGFVRVSATNNGGMVHYLLFARIHDGMSYDEWATAFHENEFAAEGMVDFYGGPNGVQPGETVSAEMNLDPGNYVVLCLIPGAGGKSHASMGMMSSVTVTDGGDAVDLAAQDIEGTVSLQDGKFVVSPGFDGQGRVLITNDGAELHEMLITQILEGGSFEEYQSTVSKGGPPEVSADYKVSQGVAVMAPGRSIIAEIDLTEGDYVFVCLAPSMTDMLPHTMHGEIQLVHFPT